MFADQKRCSTACDKSQCGDAIDTRINLKLGLAAW